MNRDNHTYPYFLSNFDEQALTRKRISFSSLYQEDFLFLCLSDHALPQKKIFTRVESYLSQKKNDQRSLKLCIYFWHYSERFNAFEYLSSFLEFFEKKEVVLKHISFKEFTQWSWNSKYRFVDFTQGDEQTPLYSHLLKQGVSIYPWEEGL